MSEIQRLRRSCLAVPGSSPKMLEKARTLPADQVFLDLEDSVAPVEKNDRTRAQVVNALKADDWNARTRVVRVNGVLSPWCYDDIVSVVAGAGERLDAIMLPKVESPAEVHYVDLLLTALETKFDIESRIALEIQIESPRGLLAIEKIASASARIETLIFGPGDYAAAAGVPQLVVGTIEPDYPGDQWHYVLGKIVTTARAFGFQAIDGPYAAISDLGGYETVARRSRLLGFDGKWSLHPTQIEICNRVYAPSQQEFDRAETLLERYAAATEGEGRGAILDGGEMIDEAVRKMALQVQAKGRAAGLSRLESTA